MRTTSMLIPILCALTLACGASQDDTRAAAAGEASPAEGAAATTPTGEGVAAAAPTDPGAAAPAANPASDFTLPDLDGNQVTLSSFRGKTVVLEWFNSGCPFVRFSHTEGPLADLARKHTANGIVWLAINSGAPGKQGAGVDVNRAAGQKWSMSHPILIDDKGDVGRAYDAKTTPHMFVIDPQGSIVYQGAIDNAPLGRVPSEGHVVYVDQALAALAAGTPVEVAETKSYGCSVKY